MYHHWGCKSIYWIMSYPFRSLAAIRESENVLLKKYQRLKKREGKKERERERRKSYSNQFLIFPKKTYFAIHFYED